MSGLQKSCATCGKSGSAGGNTCPHCGAVLPPAPHLVGNPKLSTVPVRTHSAGLWHQFWHHLYIMFCTIFAGAGLVVVATMVTIANKQGVDFPVVMGIGMGIAFVFGGFMLARAKMRKE